MNLSSGPLWLPVIYLLIHTGLILLSQSPSTKKANFISINVFISTVFLLQIQTLGALAHSKPGTLLVLWGPVIFFWWAYLWSKHTLNSVYPPEVTLDREIISFEERFFGQPALLWARKGNRFLTEVLHIAYSSYYFYTLGMGIYLDASDSISEFQVMTFSVMFGYLISYSLFALTPVHGPRWSLVEEGLMDPSEQYQKGYAVTSFTNLLMYRGPAHKGGAMPSSHSSTAVVFLIWSWRVWSPEIAVISTLIVVGMWVGSVYGRYHFVLDVLFGALIGILSVLLGDLLLT